MSVPKRAVINANKLSRWNGALQHTLAGAAVCSGIGVHSGEPTQVVVRPAPADTGIVFVRTDITGRDNRVEALASNVANTELNTEIANEAGVAVSTIEHLMAALAALSIDNAVIEIDAREVPIMDGSAQPFIALLDRAGRRTQDAARRFIEILRPVEVVVGDKRAALLPAAGFAVDFELVYDNPVIGRQRVALEVDEASFRRELARARTFGFMHEVEYLQSKGLARGGSLDNAVVIEGETILNPEGLRMEREFVRHKALDAVGDLYTLGAPILGRFESVRGGHALNNALCRELLAQPDAWCERTWLDEFAEAV